MVRRKVGEKMPELPEVETVRRTLLQAVKGKKISDVEIQYPLIIKGINPLDFKKSLINRKISDIKRIGKYLIFDLDGLYLLSHLRMEGKYFIDELNADWRKHDHIRFYLDDLILVYNDVRKFGTMHLTNNYHSHPSIVKLGKEPFEISVKDLQAKMHSKKAIKTLLLDQTVISGLGNIYVDEVLFLARLHPTTSADKCYDKAELLINSAIKTLNKAIKLGGTTIRSYTSSEGVSGKFQNSLLVHMQKGNECSVCQTPIEKIVVGGRGTYYCPHCQKC